MKKQSSTFYYYVKLQAFWASLVAQLVKNLLADEGGTRDVGLIPGLERSPGEGNGNPRWYFCLAKFK